jgi:hypothetical protein
MLRDPSFRAVRWIRTLNLLAQAVLLLTLCGGLNYLALHYGWRFDLTATHRHSLSPETISYLRELKEPVRIVVTIADDTGDARLSKARSDLGELLDDYVHATERQDAGRITTEFLDVFQNRREAARLQINQPNSLLVLCGDRRRIVSLAELYQVDIKNQEIKSFQGEQAVTAAIVAVANPVKKKISFLMGDGEMTPDDVSADRGLSAVTDELRQRNFAVDSLDLTTAHAVPADTDLLVIAGPQGRLLPATVELLRQYLSAHAGRMLVLLAPGNPHGLDDLLDDWGVLADDVLICDNSPAGQNDTGDLILTASANTSHQVIHTLVEYDLPVRFGAARSVRPDPGRTLDTSLVVTPLIGTSATTAWGERNYRDGGVPVFRPGIDLPPPLTVVTAAERVTTGGDLSLNVPSGRLVAFGGTDWIANGRETTPGNLALFLDAVNWTVGRDPQFNIPARPVERFQLALTQQQLQHLRFGLIFAGPAAIALLGFLVWWARRR